MQDSHHWSLNEVLAIYDLPLNELLYRAHVVHREHHDPNAVQCSTLLAIFPWWPLEV